MEQTAEKNNVWNAIMYLIIYSVAGFLIETTFGIVTKGVIESRKSFLYGPFCAIYGIGALAMILILRNQKSIGKLFIYGCVIGAFVEYMMSYLCEVFFNVKWWDYSGELLNINGRTCLFYAVSWGILAIVLIKFVNPYVDKFIEFFRQKNNFFKTFAILLIAFYSIDAILTGYTLKVFYYRIVAENNISTENQYQIAIKYGDIKKIINLQVL